MRKFHRNTTIHNVLNSFDTSVTPKNDTDGYGRSVDDLTGNNSATMRTPINLEGKYNHSIFKFMVEMKEIIILYHLLLLTYSKLCGRYFFF